MKFGHEAEKRQRLLYKESKLREDAENFVYKKVMGNIVYSAIPKEYKKKLIDIADKEIVNHIGEVVNDILSFEEFDKSVKDSKHFHLVYIRGYIHGGMAYYDNLISEASDEHELEEAPKKTEDILGDIEYGDITDKISEKIKKEIDKDNRKIEVEKEEEKEMEEELDISEEEDEEGFTEEEDTEDQESNEETDNPDKEDQNQDEEIDVEEESGGRITKEEGNPDATEEEKEKAKEELDDALDNEEQIGESTFEKIASGDPFDNNINPDEDYISLIKERIINGYSDEESETEEIKKMARLDTIVYISIAIAFHELKIMSKKNFLKRLEE